MEEQKQAQEKKEDSPKESKRPLRIGIICNGFNNEDILFYNEQLKEINKLYKEKIRIVVLGYKKELDTHDVFKGVVFEYVKPVSVVHYFKQLVSLRIDILFIPLIINKYNSTSENYNKYLEAGVFKIPVMTPNIYPYNKVVNHEQNGFVFDKREDFIPYLRDLLHTKIHLIKSCGENAQKDVFDNFNYSVENVNVLSSAFVW